MPTKDEDTLKKIFEEVQPANVRRRDVGGYISMLTDDIIWCPPNALDRYGKEQVAEGLTAMYATLSFDPTFTADEVKVYGRRSFGYVLGRAAILIYPVDGSKPTLAHSRELWLFRKEGGDWKLERMTWNIKPEPTS
jgi:ketosteroid isomerase-like protein